MTDALLPEVRRPSWDDVWMATADALGSRSRCDRAQVGAVIVGPTNLVLAASYNGPPHSWLPAAVSSSRCTDWCPRGRGESVDPGYADCPAAHAEMNAIARAQSSLSCATLYVTTGCCYHCAKVVANTTIVRVVARWANSHNNPQPVMDFLTNCDVHVENYPYPRSVANRSLGEGIYGPVDESKDVW